MVLKGRVRNEDRMLWREGKISEIDPVALPILEAEYSQEKGMNAAKESSKENKTEKGKA